MTSFEVAIFGNREGSHQLLETSVSGEDGLLKDLRFLVDRPVGHVGPEVAWSPYWGCGPVSGWWALWRGEEDPRAPRKNMVTSRVALVRLDAVASLDSLQELFNAAALYAPRTAAVPTASVVAALRQGVRPVVLPELSVVPALLLELWPFLWSAMKREFSIRTYFGCEAIESGSAPHVVAIPPEMVPRWRAYRVIGRPDDKELPPGPALDFGPAGPEVQRLMLANWDRLPGNLTVLDRLERIASGLKALRDGKGGLAIGLLIIRTIEGFDGGLQLHVEDLSLLRSVVSDFRGATIADIRAGSPSKLAILGDEVSTAEVSASRWIQEHLPNVADVDALWIVKQQAHDGHAGWWLRAIRRGLSNSLERVTPAWAAALWRWWTVDPNVVGWTQGFLNSEAVNEASILSHAPADVPAELRNEIVGLCARQHWPRLLAHALRGVRSLAEAVAKLRASVSRPDEGLDVLLAGRSPAEVVAFAAASEWQPLVARAVLLTISDPTLLEPVRLESAGAIALLAAHLIGGGILPTAAANEGFVQRVFDACLRGEDGYADVAIRLGAQGGRAALNYSRQEELWRALQEPGAALLHATAAAWMAAFLAGERVAKPGELLFKVIHQQARAEVRGGPAARAIRYFEMCDDVPEREVVQWFQGEGFSWARGDHERLAKIMMERKWRDATRTFRWSWKSELNAVAWHARDLLGLLDRFWYEPRGPANGIDARRTDWSSEMKILFLAANPTISDRLAIDEECRSIEENLRTSRHRDAVRFQSKWATRPSDLQQILLEVEPTVVHFSGHGGGATGLVFHADAQDADALVSASALAFLFRILKDNIRVVVLNACFSEVQARAIVDEIDFVVGMSDSIGDDAARAFAAAFYRGLAFGRTVQTAFELGIAELKLLQMKNDEDVPVLLSRKGVDASAVVLVRGAS